MRFPRFARGLHPFWFAALTNRPMILIDPQKKIKNFLKILGKIITGLELAPIGIVAVLFTAVVLQFLGSCV